MSETAETARPLIMLVITKADVGGAQMHVLQIIQAMRRDYRFVMVTGADDFLTREARNLDILVEICPPLVRQIQPLRDLTAIVSLTGLCRQYRPDLVHAHSFKAGVVARLAALASRVPSAFTAHGWSFTPGTPLAQRITGLAVEWILGRTCNAVITISQHDFRLAQRCHIGTPKQRHLVRNAAVISSSCAAPGDTPVKLLSVGRLTTVKNQRLLIAAMSGLPAEVQLTIVGEGPLRHELEQQIADAGLQSRVALTGEVEDISRYFAEAQIFVLSSTFEGLPLSILEAMASGLPVVSTDVGGVDEAVLENETGLLVPRGDQVALVNRLHALIEDPQARVRMGQAGRQHHARYFTTGRFAGEMRAVYRDILGMQGVLNNRGQT